MIRLQRPSAPNSFAAVAARETLALWQTWNGARPLRFKQPVYGRRTVKKKLKTAQHHKCAYCETKLTRDHGQVEHYRPKAGWKLAKADKLQSPGYFWLAYEGTNLFFSCAMCNDAGHKGNLFPLENPAGRATPDKPDLKAETPLLLCPFDDDPEKHIAWNYDLPKSRDQSARGKISIGTFRLDDDEDLVDDRRAHYYFIESLLEAAGQDGSSEGRNTILRNSLRDDAPWAAMIRANFKNRIEALP